MPKPVMLVVLDGFGLAPEGPGNAVALADTPNFDRYWHNYPHTQLAASGRAVGLPEGQMGNSEVGHMNIGAGRVVMQSLTMFQDLIETGAFYENEVLRTTASVVEGNALHLMGLVSNGGVHSEMSHLYALMELAKRQGVAPVYLHIFTDGRDTPPDSGLGFVAEVEGKIKELEHDIRIASVSGRYYSMDRDRRWERIQRAYNVIVCGEAEYAATSAADAVRNAYARGETDEFIKPTIIVDDAGKPLSSIRDGDALIFFNFRADRARALSYALLGGDDWDAFERKKTVKIRYASLMQYDEKMGTPFAVKSPELSMGLSETLSRAGLTQYHTAETEKYPHVTYFFNAQIEAPFPGETRELVASPTKVSTYDEQPEMSAPELTGKTLQRLREANDDFILINFANPDMVGHTGVLKAAISACEASDRGLGMLVEAVLEKGGAAIIIADHGNAEKMLDEDGNPHTAHTTNPVPCVVVGVKGEVRLRSGGILGDVAPTVLELLGVPQPAEMTGQSLLK